jgi:uncharacterized Zn finger protein (UPF0148 family)
VSVALKVARTPPADRLQIYQDWLNVQQGVGLRRMYKQITGNQEPNTARCPSCKSTMVQYTSGKLFCKNCGDLITLTKKTNKYGAKRTEYKGQIFDSKFEAETAFSLEVRKKAGDIKDYETQYQIEAWAYDEKGNKAIQVKHKVDFRILHNDGSYELLESKGIETDDYKWRRKFLEKLWLPVHPDHIYTVVRENKAYYKRKKY